MLQHRSSRAHGQRRYRSSTAHNIQSTENSTSGVARSSSNVALTAQALHQHDQSQSTNMTPMERFESSDTHPHQQPTTCNSDTSPQRNTSIPVPILFHHQVPSSSLQPEPSVQNKHAKATNNPQHWSSYACSYMIWPLPDAVSLKMDIVGIGAQFEGRRDLDQIHPLSFER